MRFIKFIKKILGLELNHLLEDEQYENIVAVTSEEHKKQNYSDSYKQLENNMQALSKAITEAGTSINDFNFEKLYMIMEQEGTTMKEKEYQLVSAENGKYEFRKIIRRSEE